MSDKPHQALPGHAHADFASDKLGITIVSHEELVGSPKKIRFVRSDGSGLPPVGPDNPAPLLVPGTGGSPKPRPAPAVEAAPLPVPTSVVEATPAEETPVSVPAVKAVPAAPTKPAPTDRVVFISDLFDLGVPCFEVLFQEETGLLSLVIPNATSLKLAPEQEVKIAHKGSTNLYWFTGLCIPIKVLDARLLVFGDGTKRPPSEP